MSFEGRYSAQQKFLHRLVFATWPLQEAIADIEDRLYAGAMDRIALDRPLFIAGLPRSGSTMLLTLLEETGVFAAHRYSDMPFLLLPILWQRFSHRFRVAEAAQERAHGDGVMIGIDSPEAFEEVLWRIHWPERYRGGVIAPWLDIADAEFRDFFHRHVRKIIAVRQAATPGAARYLGKNNGDIARIVALKSLFADAILIVPFRHPLAQARSLLGQQQNLTALQRRDPFVRDYMVGIGHYDFGLDYKPIDFAGWCKDKPAAENTSLDFWLRYWIAAYRHLLAQRGLIHLFCYDGFCAAPARGLADLARLAGLRAGTDLATKAAAVRPADPQPDESGADPALLREALALFAELRNAAAIGGM